MIPLPNPQLLTSAMLVGTALGMLAAVGASLLVRIPIPRADIVVVLVLGVPSVIGLALILFSKRRWATALGALTVAIAPAWFGLLVAIQLVTNA